MSKVQPIDLLTEQDKEDFYRYIDRGLSITPHPMVIKQYLEKWSKNKSTLFHALGNQLRVEFELNGIDEYKYERNKRISNLGINYYIYDEGHAKSFHEHYKQYSHETNIFCIHYLMFLSKCLLDYGVISWDEYASLVELQRDKAIFNGLTIQEIDLSGFRLRIPKGTKIMRAFQKVLNVMGAPEDLMDRFETFRNEMSNISTTFSALEKSTLVVSIHPLDLMSLSDNDCGWHSCFSWIGEGEYRNSCLEMLTSNLVVVAYLKSKRDYVVDPYGENPLTLPNKSYRQLFYIHKNILLAGRGYPYQDKNLSLKILDKINEMVYNNIKWKYQYRNQQYLEMEDMDEAPNSWNLEHYNIVNGKHQIFFYSDGHVYNDLALNHDAVGYWCNRNKVEKNLYLNMSGPTYCLKCGDELNDDDDSSHAICDSCYYEHYCDDCGNTYDNVDSFSYISEFSCDQHVCNDCIEEKYYFDTLTYSWISLSMIEWNYRFKHDLSYSEFHDMNIDVVDHERYITASEWKVRKECLVA